MGRVLSRAPVSFKSRARWRCDEMVEANIVTMHRIRPGGICCRTGRALGTVAA
jgi:hypothetical protein